jgi:hypothetical protein
MRLQRGEKVKRLLLASLLLHLRNDRDTLFGEKTSPISSPVREGRNNVNVRRLSRSFLRYIMSSVE